MAYYDRIAKQWHQATGYKGGAFKELVLNDILLSKLSEIGGRSILELGAGNGYFLPMVLRHFSGQIPSAIVITDQSDKLLQIAQRNFRIPQAQYQTLDVRRPFPFDDGCFDIIIASMVLNELPSRDLKKTLSESHRVLSDNGLLLISVTHPDFIHDLKKRGLLATRESVLTMPGAQSLRLPVVIRSVDAYKTLLADQGLQFEEETVFPTDKVLSAKRGLRNAGQVPLALVLKCTKSKG